jgi:hypothetical protein
MTARLDFEPPRVMAVTPQKEASVRNNITKLKIDRDGDDYFDEEIRPGEKEITPIEREKIPEITKAPVTTETTGPTTTKITASTPVEYKLNIKVEGAGAVKPPGSFTADKEGSVAVVTAVPDSGWVFDRWEGDASGSSPGLEIRMDRDKTIVAVFRPLKTGPVIDQENNPAWNGDALNIGFRQNTRQSFIHRYTTLHAVEVNIITDKAASGNEIKLNILNKDGTVIGSASVYVEAGIDGWITFDLGDGIPVNPGETYTLELVTTGEAFFRWKYAGDTYPYGASSTTAVIFDFGDFLFRTWGSNTSTEIND